MANVYLGIDGGATQARAALVDEEGHVLKEITEGGPLNFYAGADEEVRGHLAALLKEMESSCSPSTCLAGMVVGSAAVLETATPRETARLCQGVIDLERVLVVSDCLTALYGAGAGEMGVLAISGTGSVVVGRDGDADFHRVGGWGHVMGDEGSAYWIATRALARATRGADAQEDLALIEAVCRWFEVSQLADIIPLVYAASMSKARLAGLAAYLAEELPDDALTKELFGEAGRMLASQIVCLMKVANFPQGPVPLYLCGSVLEKNVVVKSAMRDQLTEFRFEVEPAKHPPHVGAALWARQHFGGRRS